MLDSYVHSLAVARKVLAQRKAAVAELEAEIAADIEERYGRARAKLQEFLNATQAEVNEYDALVRQAALDAFNENGDKHPHAAVGIREMTRLEYDEVQAIEFCRQAAPKALKLDKRAFEKIAKIGKSAGGPFDLDFVDILKEPQAAIDNDLSAFG